MAENLNLKNLTHSCNETLILSALQEEPKHGYQIAAEINEKSDDFFNLRHGTLYPILLNMEKKGLIDGEWESIGPKKKRKIYNITIEGMETLQKFTKEWRSCFIHLFAVVGQVK